MNENNEADAPATDPAPTPKVDATQAQIEALQQERAQLEDQLRRTLADAANMRRRAQKEADDARRRILEGIAQELLPVLDNFELALQTCNADGAAQDPRALVQGVRMVQTLLRSALERHGVQEITAEGQPFDPARHEAVAVEQRAGVPAGQIVRVLQRGYVLADRVVRHAKVVVAGENKAGGVEPTGS